MWGGQKGKDGGGLVGICRELTGRHFLILEDQGLGVRVRKNQARNGLDQDGF